MRLTCPECPHVVEADTRKAAQRALDRHWFDVHREGLE